MRGYLKKFERFADVKQKNLIKRKTETSDALRDPLSPEFYSLIKK